MLDNLGESIKLFYDSYVYKCVSEEEKKNEEMMKRLKKFAFIYWTTIQSYFSPICAMIGGIVA